MASAQSPTVRRRRLAGELRRLREARQMTCQQVGAELDWSKSKVSRMETGHVPLKITDVRAMLELYQVPPAEREALITLAKDAKQKGWWHAYGDAIPNWFETFVGLEAEAASIDNFEIDLLPGLLQTEDYARAMYQAARPTVAEEEVERLVRLRMARQERITGENPVRLWAIVDEAATRRVVGHAGLMRLQLEHLVEMGRLPHVTVQVLPFSAGAHPVVGTPFAILGFPEAVDPDVVYMESPTGSLYLEEATEVDWYRLAFDHLKSAALPDHESARFLAQVAKEL
ncbi:helix-turn-helix domain-containing protein [Gandjariella thermophila]|uniref:Transcriptional regulator n=1 Tax=Gandjariella thermophila TaxID=1931992 RepID=A0A4D4JCU1_9PSEU|nr:helix-turn-helix transcriptional regulator [Gandjariella thermophila]GDY32820.1 transcriptional regulator [Gandjariella thermophila]